MKRAVITAYKPKPGCEAALLALVQRHRALLEMENLITEREPIVMRAADGTILEVFEWRSLASITEARSHPAVSALRDEFRAVCEFLPLAKVPEAQKPSAEFDGV
jgi:hypothetical protein